MPDDFDALMRRASGGAPYPYQRRLADNGFPELLAVETGAGKTAAVFFAWLWRRRFHPDRSVRESTPRWLVLCEPMRTLTEQAERVIARWLGALTLTDDVLVHVVMGGRDDGQRTWRLHPERDAVVIGTVDMLLSRVLNRGYGASRFSWPLDFGLLNSGTHWVFDEVQLLGPALPTSRQLQGLRSALGTAMETSSTWMSATVERGGLSTVDNPYVGGPGAEVRLGEEDWADPELAVRLSGTRRVEKIEFDGKKRPTALARAAVDLHRKAALRQPGALTLVVVNQVATAQAVFDALKKLAPGAALHLLHGRLRPADRRRATAAALDQGQTSGEAGRIVVSTQVVEAGVDISAAALLTEAAPWPSIVQRAGRCNRDGRTSGAVLAWVPVASRDAQPYEAEDVEATVAALEAMEGEEVTATALGERKVPVSAPQQPVLRRTDLLSLFDTAPDVSGNDVDVGPFIRDGEERDVFVAWRDDFDGGRPRDDVTVGPDELCKVPRKEAVELLRKDAWRFDHLGGRRREWVKLGAGETPRPGEILLVPSTAGGYDPEVGWTPKVKAAVPPVPGPGRGDVVDPDDNVTESVGADPVSQIGQWVALHQHLADVEAAVRALVRCLAPRGVSAAQLEAAAVAGRLHDIGKAHEIFQESLLRLANDERERLMAGVPWAKSGSRGILRHRRRAFRHELASALALLGDAKVVLRGVDEPDLVVYLVAAHHGRVRLGIRSVQELDDNGDVLGIREGDELPGVELPRGETPPVRLSLGPVRMGRSPDGDSPSWSERALRLLEELGPFRLGFLEAVVRLADWRASAEEGGAEKEVLTSSTGGAGHAAVAR